MLKVNTMDQSVLPASKIILFPSLPFILLTFLKTPGYRAGFMI